MTCFFASKKTKHIQRKAISILMIWAVLLSQFSPLLFIGNVQAASSWQQTDWSGGSGQTDWSNTDQYSSASNIVDSIGGELSLTNTEELSNTGFESDTSSWGVASKQIEINSLVDSKGGVYWPLQETSGSLANAYNTALSEGRNVLVDGDMEAADTSAWTGTNAALSKGTTNPHGGSRYLVITNNSGGTTSSLATQSFLVSEKTYRVHGYGRSADGVGVPRVANYGTVLWNGTTSANWQEFDEAFTACTGFNCDLMNLSTSYKPNGTSVEFDDVTVTQTNIAASSTFSTPGDNPFDSSITGATVGQAGPVGDYAYSFDGTSDYVDIYSPELNSVFDPDKGTMFAFAKVANSGVWTDGSDRAIMDMRNGTTDLVVLRKGSADNEIEAFYKAGGLTKTVDNTSFNSTDWFLIAMTWDTSADEMKFYLNGNQFGSTQTSLGDWLGNFDSDKMVIGAETTTPNKVWSGSIAHPTLLNEVLSASEISSLYQNISAISRDTGTTYNSSSGAAKIVATSDTNFVQSVNVGDTNNYNFSVYAYTDGSAVTSSDAELYYNGSTVSTTYTDQGSGWYKLSGTITGANASRDVGVQVKSGKTVYLDDFSLNSYASSGSLTSSIYDSGQASEWGTLTYSASTPSNTSASVKVRTSNNSDMSGATDFASCNAIVSGNDISSNSCVSDGHQYVQYQVTLSTSDVLISPSLSNISLSFSTYDTEGPSFELDSPGDNNYTNNDRPSFRWKAATDTVSGVASYVLSIDNPSLGNDQPPGDFSISDIPISRTENYETDKYVVSYEGFEDSDSSNDYISVYTKASDEWNDEQNNGQLREGKVSWSVKASDGLGNETTHSRTLLVDRNNPKVNLTQINNQTELTTYMTSSDQTPTISGRIIDKLAGVSNSSDEQLSRDNKVASGPKSYEINIEKQDLTGLYSLYTSAKINITDKYWLSTGEKIEDNSTQHPNGADQYEEAGKYTDFSYTPDINLPYGNYKITVVAKDEAENNSSAQSFELKLLPYQQLYSSDELDVIEKQVETQYPDLTKKEKLEKIEEITSNAVKETAIKKPNFIQKTITSLAQSTSKLYWKIIGGTKGLAGSIASGLFHSGQAIASIGNNILSTGGKTIVYVGSGLAGIGQSVNNSVEAIASRMPKITQTVVLATKNTITGYYAYLGKQLTHNKDTLALVTSRAGNLAMTVSSPVVNSLASFIEKQQIKMVIIAEVLFDQEPSYIDNVKITEVGKDYAIITWTTNHYTKNNKVNYGESLSYGQSVISNEYSRSHSFKITDLKPGAKYYFEVMSQGKNYVYDAHHEFNTTKNVAE